MNITFHNTISTKGKNNPYPGKEPEADICLLLEGTYPFVSGGVSSWVHSLIKGLPDFTFSLYVILPDSKRRKTNYEIPTNVTGLYLHYLNHKNFNKKPLFSLPRKEQYLDDIVKLHQLFPETVSEGVALNMSSVSNKGENTQISGNGENKDIDPLTPLFKNLLGVFKKQNRDIPSRVISRKTWKIINRIYQEKDLNCSFVDYFWTWRYQHHGIFSIMNAHIPKAKIYHAVSTGYAGFAGAKASALYNAPLVLTEHGIYNKERKIDISRSPWIYEERRHLFRPQANLEVFKELWIKAFTAMSKLCYEASSSIITLYTGNQNYQLMDGADPRKMEVIPNGIDFKVLSSLKRIPQEKKIIGFVGRIVPIKDVKTLLRAVALVFKSYPNAEVWLMGPTDENQQYYEECVQLVEFLEIGDKVRFTGMVDLRNYYPKLDILVLTSISEAQPLVILEAFCLGIPVVATDVGACRELVEGAPGADAELGKSGIITGLTNPAETAFSILHLLRSEEDSVKMGQAGKERARRYYDLPKLFGKYRQLYLSSIETKNRKE